MNVVLIGDIGWQFLYHLGDEAMTEAAIDMLRARGIDDITLVAGEPEYAREFYGLPAVRRVRFRPDWSRARNEWRLSDVARVLAEEDWDDHPIYPAIRDADAVVIAGGGNMNSRDYHLLFERVAAKRIAEHFGTPLIVTSQTVGPMLDVRDRELVVEIADYALAFGAREAVTTALLREHAQDPSRIHHTLDDALMLAADSAAYRAVEELTGGRPFIVASFTHHPGTMWNDEDEYYRDIARLSCDVSDAHDVDVLLAPHAGSLDPAATARDQEGNTRIAEFAGNPRVRATRMITAREDVALIEHSRLSLSTRYHPTVFAPAVGTPAVAIAPSYYSSIRMRGSLGNVGLQAFVLPRTSLHLMRDAIAEAIEPHGALQSHLDAAKDRALAFQTSWWDAVVASISTRSGVVVDDVPTTDVYVPRGSWTRTNEQLYPLADQYAKMIDARNHLAEELDAALDREEKLRVEHSRIKEALARSERRLSARIGRRLRKLLRHEQPQNGALAAR